MTREDIKMIDDTMASMNREVIGATTIDYPVYMVHLEYRKPDSDPMYYIDWAIVHFMKSQPILNEQLVADMVGMKKNLISYRVRCLVENLYVRNTEDGYVILPEGLKRFFTTNDARPFINDSSDLLVDGKKIFPMDAVFYKNLYDRSQKPYISFDRNSIFSRTILKGSDDQKMEKLLYYLEHISNDKKDVYNLPKDSIEYKSADTPSEGLLRLYLVFSKDENGLYYKDIVYKGNIIDLPSIDDIIQKSYFYGDVEFNYGYDTADKDELCNVAFKFQPEELRYLIGSELRWSFVEDSWFTYSASNKKHILTINMSIENLEKCEDKNKAIKCIRSGYVEVSREETDNRLPASAQESRFFRIPIKIVDPALIRLLEFDQKVLESKREKEFADIADIFKEYGITYSRQSMILLGKYDYLEEIDTRIYINGESA